MFAPGKYKPGQFIKTPFGRMRVRKANFAPCKYCAIRDVKDCFKLTDMHNLVCSDLLGNYGYLEKV